MVSCVHSDMDSVQADPVVRRNVPFAQSKLRLCLTTGPQPLAERVLHRVRSSTVSFKFQYTVFNLTSSSSCSSLLLRLPVPSISPSISPSITYFRRQFIKCDQPSRPSSFLSFLLYVGCNGLPSLYAVRLRFSPDRSN
jgi:hypothetical protein